MKDLQNLNDAKILSKKEQQSITGGAIRPVCENGCTPVSDCCTTDNLCGKIGTGGICYPV